MLNCHVQVFRSVGRATAPRIEMGRCHGGWHARVGLFSLAATRYESGIGAPLAQAFLYFFFFFFLDCECGCGGGLEGTGVCVRERKG